jgi:hypothetical protein
VGAFLRYDGIMIRTWRNFLTILTILTEEWQSTKARWGRTKGAEWPK